jgi:membrane fusion protein (multidrug efflux system)
MSEASSGKPANSNSSARRRWLIVLAAVVVVGAALWGIYWFAYARFYESTDDAYVGGDIVSITSREPATVLAIHADNTQAVRRGQLLIELDPARAKAAMQSAQANLAKTVRAVRSDFSKVHQFDSQIAAAKVQLAQAQGDYRRRKAGAVDGSVSGEEVAHAHDAVAAANAALRVAEAGQAQAVAAVDNTSVASNPNVLAAIARVRDAAITLSHMKLVSPVNGVVAQRAVQVGQQVAAGTPLMAVVPLDDVWIEANFKEGQLRDMRVGQPVEVTADIYGGSVTYHGHVAGLGAGSGAAFSLLPPQNASGNWIKIVQRVPVRIALDPKELHDHPLRIGLSVTASVDVSDTSGPMVSAKPLNANLRGEAADASAQADRIVQRILAQNGAAR